MTGEGRLSRCLACGGKVKVAAESRVSNCPLCGLTLLAVPGFAELAPLVVPRVGKERAWEALVREQALPAGENQTVSREEHLLLVPFWRLVDEAKRSVARTGRVASGAELLSCGLPSMRKTDDTVRGLDVKTRSRTGDAMGRLEDGSALPDCVILDVTAGPPGMTPAEALATDTSQEKGWRLFYYPVWSFRYAVFSKENFHVVDATNGCPVGPARRVRWPAVALASAVSMLAFFLAGLVWLGPFAAAPAWAGSVVVMRAAMLAQRK